jgi:hypothetical protein
MYSQLLYLKRIFLYLIYFQETKSLPAFTFNLRFVQNENSFKLSWSDSRNLLFMNRSGQSPETFHLLECSSDFNLGRIKGEETH